MGRYLFGSRSDRLFYDGLNLMMGTVYFMFLCVVVDALFLGARGDLTLLSIVIGVPVIVIGYSDVRRYFTARSCPVCGSLVPMSRFSCPECGERFLGVP